LIPLGSSVEVDFWVFEDSVLIGHNNINLAKLASYPTLEQFLAAWSIKRNLEVERRVTHGMILANLKTHGSEERLFELFKTAGLGPAEFALLDQEAPASARILGAWNRPEYAPIALRISAIEPLSGVLKSIEFTGGRARPAAIFLDPLGFSATEDRLGISAQEVGKLYELAPDVEFILCCPSRWGQASQIGELAEFLKLVGFRTPMVMTDTHLFSTWQVILDSWRARHS
jgi:hypothetical protein